MKRPILILMCILLLGVFAGCKGKDKEKTNSDTAPDVGTTQVDIKAADRENIESAIDNYDPDDGYEIDKSEVKVSSNTVGETYNLKQKDSSESVGCIYVKKSGGVIEVDIHTAGFDEKTVDAAYDMLRHTVESVFPKFPFNKIKGVIPMSYKEAIKIVEAEEDYGNCIYSDDMTASFSYEYIGDGTLTYMISYEGY